LLLTMGKFDESIAQYRKALSVDPHFVASHFGMSADLTYMGKPQEATAELQKIVDGARNDGETRLALFGMAVVAADSGKMDQAVQAIDREYGRCRKEERCGIDGSRSQAKGIFFWPPANSTKRRKTFDDSLQKTEGSGLLRKSKTMPSCNIHFNLTMVAVGKKDYATAKSEAEEYRKGAEASGNSAQVKQAHEAAGVIALAEKKYDNAIAELEQGEPAESAQPVSAVRGVPGEGR
jgi:tetratricopeptide (TPR) repeat protein